MSEIRKQSRIIQMIQDIQFKLMRTATLENKTHAERNAETRDLVKDLQSVIDIVKLNPDIVDEIYNLPF